jgi:hypothetical protein
MVEAATRPNVRIFVSSTFTDMQLYRRKVQDALTQLETTIRGMEQFGSKPGSPVEECLKIVGSCRLYVGVFGMRYGSVPDGYDKAMTHIEYDEAQRLGLPSLVYILDENHPIPAKNVETGPGAEKLRELKEQLARRHIVSFFTTPEDLQARIMHDVPSLLEQMGVEVAAELGERTTLRERRRRGVLQFQAALRALLAEILGAAELALSGSGTVFSWPNPSGKSPAELKIIAQEYEGKIPFSSAKYFRDRVWSKYEDVLLENLDAATISALDGAYGSARQVFDLVGAPISQGATYLHPSFPYILWRVASDFSKAIPLLVERLADIEERKQLEPRIRRMTSMVDSQSKVVN